MTTGELQRTDVQRRIAEARGPSPIALSDLTRITTKLARELTPADDEEDELGACLACWALHLPGRRFVARLVDPETSRVDLVRSTARLRNGEPEHVRVTTDALRRAGLDLDVAQRVGIEVVATYQPDCEPGASGCDACLVVDGILLGVVGVEYAVPHAPPAGDVEALDLLACQLAATLQRSRARHEATYLSGYLSRLLDHANVPIAVLDRHRRVQVASQAMLDLVGRARDELVGRDLMRHVRDDHRAELLDAIASALRGATARESFEVTIVGATGRNVRMLTNLVPVRSPEGTVDGILLIGRDVTELRALENQILQAEKLATLGQLAAGVVHELNNPLTSISVYADYLHAKWTREDASVDDRAKLQRIRQAAERVVRFSRDLVSYARPSHEAPSSLDVREVVEQSLGFCEHVIAEAGALIERRFTPHPVHVLAVRAQLHQVLINLVTNACHAMPQGAGRLLLETEERDGHVVVRVSDNGAGISPDHLAQIFEPFFSTKGEGQGTGLGLSIAKKIIEHHGGELRVQSLLGAGTTFEVVIPVHA